MGETINDNGTENIEAGAAGAPEGAQAPEPSTDDVQKMYDDLGIKAKAPSAKSPGRPKANASGAKADSKQDDASGTAGQGKDGDADGSNKSKTASASGSDGSDGGAADSKGSKSGTPSGKNGQADGKVSKSGEDDANGVSADESRNNEDASKSGEGDDDDGNGGTGKDGGESEDASQEGKRPGKSNPEVEKRFQQLTAEKKAAEQRAIEAEQKLQESTRKQQEARIQSEDPEYTVEDFKKVRDRDGNIHDLDDDRAELAWRRWKEGYEQRAAERDAEVNRATAREEHEAEMTRQVMRDSVEAYDSLASMMDDYQELVSTSKDYDEEFAKDAMPIINKSIVYLEGTEPGNAEDKLPVIIGMRFDPREILDTLKRQNERKRSLPLNGTRDSVESRSNVAVPHSRSSDPTVNAANDLYKQLGIDKRI